MASRLDDFLGLMDVTDIRKAVSVKVDGKDFEIVIRPLTEDEHTEFQRRSNTISRNKIMFDSGKYNDLLLSSCIVEPNFSDEHFLKKVGCISGVEFLKKKFTAGQLSDIAGEIQRLSGFETFEMEVDTAKN